MTSCINRGFFLMPQQEISGANRRAADRLAYAGASARRSPQPGSHTFLVDDSSWHCPKAPWRAAPRCAKMVPPFQMRVSHQLVGFRRDSPIASRPGESRLAERTPAVRPWWRELYKMPLKRPSRSSLTGPCDVSLSEPRGDVQPAAAATVQPTPRSRPSGRIRMRPSQIP